MLNLKINQVKSIEVVDKLYAKIGRLENEKSLEKAQALYADMDIFSSRSFNKLEKLPTVYSQNVRYSKKIILPDAYQKDSKPTMTRI